MMTGYYGSIHHTWLHQQGRGAHHVSIHKPAWFCEGCQREHSGRTCRFVALDGKSYCQREFLKLKG